MLICTISDTHGYHRKLKLPEADVLIHAGDMSSGRGSLGQIQDFNDWLGSLPHKHKIIIPGNHDFPFENDLPLCREMMSNGYLLVDQEIIIDGIKFYGSPWQPEFHNWAFNLERGESLAKIWANIPENTDVLITHGPVSGILDLVEYDNINVGCEELSKRIFQINPKIHICGHIHEGRGLLETEKTLFINSSICDNRYRPSNKPFLIELINSKTKVIDS